jgi:nucleoside 2-deoxyribosyltransferase
MKKVYLAGPDVFAKDAIERGKMLKELCEKFGFKGLFPFDNEVSQDESDPAFAIFNGNASMIQQCDYVLANLEPFHGPSVDVGTSWEIGYAYGLGKYIAGYNKPSTELIERVVGEVISNKYPIIEDFGGFDNLMISESISAWETIEEALWELKTITSRRN